MTVVFNPSLQLDPEPPSHLPFCPSRQVQSSHGPGWGQKLCKICIYVFFCCVCLCTLALPELMLYRMLLNAISTSTLLFNFGICVSICNLYWLSLGNLVSFRYKTINYIDLFISKRRNKIPKFAPKKYKSWFVAWNWLHYIVKPRGEGGSGTVSKMRIFFLGLGRLSLILWICQWLVVSDYWGDNCYIILRSFLQVMV